MSAARKQRTPRGRLMWTAAEDAVLRSLYPAKGVRGCVARLPGRSAGAIEQRSYKLGVRMDCEARGDLLSAALLGVRRGRGREPAAKRAAVEAFDAVSRAWATRRERRAA